MPLIFMEHSRIVCKREIELKCKSEGNLQHKLTLKSASVISTRKCNPKRTQLINTNTRAKCCASSLFVTETYWPISGYDVHAIFAKLLAIFHSRLKRSHKHMKSANLIFCSEDLC